MDQYEFWYTILYHWNIKKWNKLIYHSTNTKKINLEYYISKSLLSIDYKFFKNNKDIWTVKPKEKSSWKTIDNDFTDIKSDNYIIAKFIYTSHLIKESKYIIKNSYK